MIIYLSPLADSKLTQWPHHDHSINYRFSISDDGQASFHVILLWKRAQKKTNYSNYSNLWWPEWRRWSSLCKDTTPESKVPVYTCIKPHDIRDSILFEPISIWIRFNFRDSVVTKSSSIWINKNPVENDRTSVNPWWVTHIMSFKLSWCSVGDRCISPVQIFQF